MRTIYLAMKHPEHPYDRGSYLMAGMVVEAFDNRKSAVDFVADKNKKSASGHWSVKAKRVNNASMVTNHKLPTLRRVSTIGALITELEKLPKSAKLCDPVRPVYYNADSKAKELGLKPQVGLETFI